MLIPGDAARQLVGPLTASMKMAFHPLTRERVDLTEAMPWVAELKVVAPTLQLSIELGDQQRRGFEAHPAAGHLTESLTLSRQRFLRRNHVHIEQMPPVKRSEERRVGKEWRSQCLA